MPNPIFDGLPDIFVDTFGEPVVYMPDGGSPVAIQAIWTEGSLVDPIGLHAGSDIGVTTLSVRAADVTPAEGDIVQRVEDGKTMKVTTPILPDGKGMIVCNLADVS